MKIELGFGQGTQIAEFDDNNLQAVLLPNKVSFAEIGEDAVIKALKNPIGKGLLRDEVKNGQKVAIITSDITRPMPSKIVLPFVLDELNKGGIPDSDITVVFGLGSHRRQTEEEQRRLVGDAVFERVNCIDAPTDDCIHLGDTKRGTPVDIVRPVAEADFVICLGNIEYHYFAGYSGGAKAIMPGASTREAIQCNHRFMVDDNACAGKIEGNPIREDIEEAAEMLGVDYIVNVVLDEHKKIVYSVAGDVTLAHREGCKFLDKLYACEIEKKADIVIVSQGGAPKDLNLYQTQKALDNAKHAIRDGGVVILVGSCKEGLGEKTFEEWMTKSESPEAMIERIGVNFELGGHKAAAIAMVLAHADIYLVSEMEKEFVEGIFLKPFANVQEALDSALEKLGKDASILVMPFGGSTLPVLK